MLARMERATRLLSSRYLVRVAAEQSGFRSHAHFTRTFTAHIGLTPQEYRRAATTQHRIQYRIFKDKVDPVKPGSPEYFRRRKRWREDGRRLHRLVAKAHPFGRAKLAAHAPPERSVVDLAALRRSQRAHDRHRWADRLETIRDRWFGDPDRPAFLDADEDAFEYLDDDW